MGLDKGRRRCGGQITWFRLLTATGVATTLYMMQSVHGPSLAPDVDIELPPARPITASTPVPGQAAPTTDAPAPAATAAAALPGFTAGQIAAKAPAPSSLGTDSSGTAQAVGAAEAEAESFFHWLVEAYFEQHRTAPMATRAALGALLYVAADTFLQVLEQLRDGRYQLSMRTDLREDISFRTIMFMTSEVSVRRLSVALMVGAAYVGVLLPLWYYHLDELTPTFLHVFLAVLLKANLSLVALTPILAFGSYIPIFENEVLNSRTWDDTFAERLQREIAELRSKSTSPEVARRLTWLTAIWPGFLLGVWLFPLEFRCTATALVATACNLSLANPLSEAVKPTSELTEEEEIARQMAVEAARAWAEAYAQSSGVSAAAAALGAEAAADDIGGGPPLPQAAQSPFMQPEALAVMQEKLLKTIEKNAPPMIQDFLKQNAQLLSAPTEQLLGPAKGSNEQVPDGGAEGSQPVLVQGRVMDMEETTLGEAQLASLIGGGDEASGSLRDRIIQAYYAEKQSEEPPAEEEEEVPEVAWEDGSLGALANILNRARPED